MYAYKFDVDNNKSVHGNKKKIQEQRNEELTAKEILLLYRYGIEYSK